MNNRRFSTPHNLFRTSSSSRRNSTVSIDGVGFTASETIAHVKDLLLHNTHYNDAQLLAKLQDIVMPGLSPTPSFDSISSENISARSLNKLDGSGFESFDHAVFSPTSNFLAVSNSRAKQLAVWTIESNGPTPDEKLKVPELKGQPVEVLRATSGQLNAIAASESLIAVATQDAFEVYEYFSDRPFGRSPIIGPLKVRGLHAIALSTPGPTGTVRLCIGTVGTLAVDQGMLKVWNITRTAAGSHENGNQKISTVSIGDPGVKRIPSAIAISYCGNRVVVGCTNGDIAVYQIPPNNGTKQPPDLIICHKLEGNLGSMLNPQLTFTGLIFLTTSRIAFTAWSDLSCSRPAIFDIGSKSFSKLINGTQTQAVARFRPNSLERIAFIYGRDICIAEDVLNLRLKKQNVRKVGEIKEAASNGNYQENRPALVFTQEGDLIVADKTYNIQLLPRARLDRSRVS